jgi:hypothetical protein
MPPRGWFYHIDLIGCSQLGKATGSNKPLYSALQHALSPALNTFRLVSNSFLRLTCVSRYTTIVAPPRIAMAPPGFAPPSYVHSNIPTRHMHKDPPPAGEDTNARAYVIFFSYLGLCLSLSAFIVYKLVQNYNVLSKSTTARLPARAHVRIFAMLAVLSLLTTWYYMFNYFRVSYQAWAMWRSRYEVSQDRMHWGLWLTETSLFREAWETVIVGNARYWWSHQIFFFACGLGLSLEERGMSPV